MHTDIPSAPQDIKPFVLHEQPEEFAHLCAVRTYGEWLEVSQITHGYIFCRIASGDQTFLNNQQMVKQLLVCSLWAANLQVDS